MHLKPHTISAALVLSLSVVLSTYGCKSENTLPPAPASLINNTRDRLNPFRFTLATEPSAPTFHDQIMLKVHIIDAANRPADGVEVNADLSMPGMNGPQHVAFSGTGDGEYEGAVSLEMAGTWDVDLTASKDGKSSKQRLSIEVGG